MAADPSKLSFFSLPGEIRNMITNLVLVPGDVYPHTLLPTISTRIPVSAANVQSRSGVQLIATCRQAYNEGHVLFYSLNTFYLPATETFEWSDRLQPKHKCLIKRIGITIGPNELDASMICRIDNAYINLGFKKHVESDVEPYDEFDDLQEAVIDTLHKTWYSKMRHVAAWKSLEEITLCLFKDPYIPITPLHHKYTLQNHEHTFQHCELVANFEKFPNDIVTVFWETIFSWPCVLVLANIFAKNVEMTWTGTIEWLYVRKPDELAGDFWGGVEYVDDEMGGIRPW